MQPFNEHTSIFTLTMNKKNSYELQKVRGKWLWPRVECTNHLVTKSMDFFFEFLEKS